MSWRDLFRPGPASDEAIQAANARRGDDILASLAGTGVAPATAERLGAMRDGRLPWLATFSPSELLVGRSHGIRPVAAVSATCWLHYGFSWTEGHAEGWRTALRRLRQEARAAGAQAVVDVRMRTVPFGTPDSMDFTLFGTAVAIDGLPPSDEPVVATVPALEFVRLLDAGIVPIGLAVGATFSWMDSYAARRTWMGNTESTQLSQFWRDIRRSAWKKLARDASHQGHGVLAHVNFSQMFEFEGSGENSPKRYLGRHIVVATVIDGPRGARPAGDVTPLVDLRDATSPFRRDRASFHGVYELDEREGEI